MNIENMKNMAKIQSLGVLFLISETLAAQQYAQPIEKIFPCLTALTSSSEVNGDKVYALIATDGTNFIALKDAELVNGNYMQSEVVNSSTEQIDKDNLFHISSDYLKGLSTEKKFYHKKNNNISNSSSNKIKLNFYYLDNDFYKGLIINNNEKEAGNVLSYNASEGYSKFYVFYNSSTDYPPYYIFECDTTKMPKALDTLEIKTAEGYATIYRDESYIMPQGLTGYTITSSAINYTEQALSLTPAFEAGEVVPTKTALLVKGEAYKSYILYEATSDGSQARATRSTTVNEDNLLYGLSKTGLTTQPTSSGKYFFYKLYYLSEVNSSTKRLGFFWGAENGGAFTSEANKAYLAVEQGNGNNASSMRGFALPQGTVSSITISTRQEQVTPHCIYTLQGVSINPVHNINELPAGVYIIDGQKKIIR